MVDLEKIKQQLTKFFENESSGHDLAHAERVLNLARKIQSVEGGNLEVISIAALVHDMYRPWEKETGKSHFGDEALQMMRAFLDGLISDQKIIDQVIAIVKLHDIYDWTEKMSDKSIELQIMQDADNIDALGAIGIGRTFAFGGSNSRPMWVPGENLDFDKDFVENPNHLTSTIAHFYEKLLKLKDNMNTKTGKQMAESRHKFMETFLKEFFAEWEAKV